MTINIEYEAEEKLDLDYEKIITDVVNEAVDYVCMVLGVLVL